MAFGVLDDARARQQRRHRRLAAALVLLLTVATSLIAAGLIATASDSGGGKRGGQPTTTISSSAHRQFGEGVAFRFPRGHAQAWFSVNGPNGVIVFAQISVPHGARAFMNATTVGGSIRVTTWGAGGSLSCSTRAGADVCKQLMEQCPFGAAVWRLHVVKLGGPAGLVRVKLGFGPLPPQDTQAVT